MATYLVVLALVLIYPYAVESGLSVTTASHHRLFPNVSLGIGVNGMQHQCDDKGKRLPTELASEKTLGYTPNRRKQADTVEAANSEQLQLAFVLAMGAHQDGVYDYGKGGSKNGLVAVWDSWAEHFFSRTSNTTSIILLLDERDFDKQNHTRSKERYLDSLVVDNMGAVPVECVKQHPNPHPHPHQHGGSLTHPVRHNKAAAAGRRHTNNCGNRLLLDQTYHVYSYNFDDSRAPSGGEGDTDTGTGTGTQAPLIIFAAVQHFPRPDWAEGEDEDTLYIHWRPKGLPPRFNTNYGYTKMTNWYAYHMLNLKILDYFDYAGKIDNDVSFMTAFPETNLPLRMAGKGAKMLVTQKQWYYDDPRIANGVEWCLHNYMQEESKLCGGVGGDAKALLVPPNEADQTFWEGNFNTTFRAHFLVYWLGLYTAPEVKHMAQHWNDWHPKGMWDFRWGDQQWWPRPLSVFDSDPLSKSIDHYATIDTDNNKYVVHKAYPLSATLKDCDYFKYEGNTAAERKKCFKKVYSKYVY